MTRINLVPPKQLHSKHLVAEYRELPRVFRLAKHIPGKGTEYTMGTGHVIFFYDKLKWCYLRQGELVREMMARGYKPSHLAEDLIQFATLKPQLWNNWTPSENEIFISQARLIEKMPDYYEEIFK